MCQIKWPDDLFYKSACYWVIIRKVHVRSSEVKKLDGVALEFFPTELVPHARARF
jgi:hypothetical protein